MTGVGHLSTGLWLKGKFPRAPLPVLLLAAVAPDLVWAFLNLVPNPGAAPVEVVALDRPFSYIGSQHLLLQPWSHSLSMTVLLAGLFAAATYLAFRDARVALAVLLAGLGHWVADYLVHDADLTLWPAVDAMRVGPPFVLDAGAPTRGLFTTAPLVGFALQTLVVIVGARTFLRAFPIRVRKDRVWFWAGIAFLVLLSLPVFVKDALAARITSTPGLVMGALAEMAVAAVVIAAVARRGGVTATPVDAAFVRRVFGGIALLCGVVAALHLGQSMRDAQTAPAVGAWSTAMAALYLLLARSFGRGNPIALWGAILLTLIVDPILRAVHGPGSLAVPILLVELGVGGLSVMLVQTLLRRDLML